MKDHSFGILNNRGMAGYRRDSCNSCTCMLIDNPAASFVRLLGLWIKLPQELRFLVLVCLRDSACSLPS